MLRFYVVKIDTKVGTVILTREYGTKETADTVARHMTTEEQRASVMTTAAAEKLVASGRATWARKLET